MRREKIGIIGFGNMGSAIAEQLKSGYKILVFDKDFNKTKNLSDIKVAKDNIDLVSKVDVVILAVKPQDFDNLLMQIKKGIKKQLIISIAAGITTSYIERYLGRVKVIRVMPNISTLIRKGVCGLCKGRFASNEDLRFTKKLLSHMGISISFDKEKMLDAVTAISGSGPAYLCYYIKERDISFSKKDRFIQELTKAAISIGFKKDIAERLSEQTATGTLFLLKKMNLSPEELITKVASKGGTTEKALEVLSRGGSLEEAVKAALKRARELSRRR
ncbi:MAG: pyrroline-5-carboxylate reductase [Candidatus Omnitrophica bacterium]|nr:pyrroline-5-carboxylate reductase [Candidatus Omnitrophota bacterium]